MPLQYISDAAGNHTAVIIPINEWESITNKHKDLKQLEAANESKSKEPSDFAGSLSEEGYQALNEHIKNARNEWDRATY